MPAPEFLHEHREFTDLLRAVAEEKSIAPDLVEKDYWIMHCLYGLEKQGYAFELKGGTSLSKGFNIIHRFSEDIDLRINPPADINVAVNPRHTKPKHCASRKAFYNQIAEDITIHGIEQAERDTDFDDPSGYYRSGGLRLNYQAAFPISAGVKQGILLELGFDNVTPYIPQTISSWALNFARARDIAVFDNRAVGVACYHPGYTLVEKLQTIATKYRQQQQSGDMPKNFMRHYYDVACLLDHDMVKSFIGSEDYHAHKATRFPQKDFKISLDENEAFLLSDPNTKALYRENYEATSGLYYESQPSFQSLLDTILNVIQTL